MRLVYRHTLAMRGSDQSEDHLIGIAFHGGGRNESGEPPRTQPYLLAAVSSCGTGAADTAGREARASKAVRTTSCFFPVPLYLLARIHLLQTILCECRNFCTNALASDKYPKYSGARPRAHDSHQRRLRCRGLLTGSMIATRPVSSVAQ